MPLASNPTLNVDPLPLIATYPSDEGGD